ncbi:MAG: PaaI family thioesterase [Chloroflexota bacterium]
MSESKAFQDYYDEFFGQCYGCGSHNEHGLQIKSRWDGDESVAEFDPKPYHTAMPGFVYGGLIASLIDCHSTGTASAAGYRAEGREMGTKPLMRYVTGSLQVKYIKPTPIGVTLHLRSKVKSIEGRKVLVDTELFANDELCATGQVLAVKIPEDWGK